MDGLVHSRMAGQARKSRSHMTCSTHKRSTPFLILTSSRLFAVAHKKIQRTTVHSSFAASRSRHLRICILPACRLIIEWSIATMSYQNGASNGDGYQPIESSMSNGGKSGVCTCRSSESKRCGWCRSIFWEVQKGLRRCESGWMDIASSQIWSDR